MRTKALAAACAIAVVLVVLCGYAVSQENVKEVNDPGFTKRIRPAVSFVHDAHNEKAGIDDCAVCHHVVENGIPSDTETSEDQP